MMALELLAQQYLPISPRHLSLLTLDGGSPAAVVAVSPAYDNLNRVFFLEWDYPTETGNFRLIHTEMPGVGVNALSLMLSQDGVVHCVVQCASKGKEESPKTYLLRRTEDAGNSDSDTSDNGSEEDTAVKYKILPKVMEDDSRSWTVATRLYRGNGGVRDSNNSSRVVAACGGERGEPNALKMMYLSGTRLSVQQSVELPVLSTFPLLRLCEIDGDVSSLLALCHHAVLEIDPRLKQQESVVRAWKWTPRDPLTAFAVKDNSIVAGTEDGVLVLWDLRFAAVHEKGSKAVDHSVSCGAPITGLHMPHSSSVLSCQADGAVLTWERCSTSSINNINEACFVPRRIPALPPTFVGTPGCVGMAAEDNIAVVADESGVLSIFSMS
ncbi:hypothetical protein, conserved [Trypanosoma brucei gambiense DAL972]|uniref:Guanine nucleotide-binding protein subunit beta-like protein n=2 Tax=Trypanosoma brucei TaxID=5691 RepID=D0A1Q3_TRYB9|nr:hypothetical protein, conserved [Trypanosoma brucei gambiense DAL972]RHW69159.1 hypothetical protein DPX39_100029000 [Trypanosoma brucei equiperdum]CBH15196.1 hypothetical protein, conserved [Trypanosoma brucei gambiense DAL972]|eukprot:XP_011777461.1 hypothetical protein, conserved [Trypanosoma brucei gambiense DAL972]